MQELAFYTFLKFIGDSLKSERSQIGTVQAVVYMNGPK